MIRKIAISLALLVSLSGCLGAMQKAAAPLPTETQMELQNAGLTLGAPIYVRVFKREAQMEVWMAGPKGDYQLFRTYDICNWSGDLGPKVKEGDKQAPEGYYTITPRQMNPNSKYYLSFNVGFPNAYDRAHGRTGNSLMVHGGCLSAGCYAITDGSVQELYILAREAFAAGQNSFQFHAYPFRLTAQNLAAYKDNKWYGFWQNLKQGYDLFEKTHVPPGVDVSGGRYVFLQGKGTAPKVYETAAVPGNPT